MQIVDYQHKKYSQGSDQSFYLFKEFEICIGKKLTKQFYSRTLNCCIFKITFFRYGNILLIFLNQINIFSQFIQLLSKTFQISKYKHIAHVCSLVRERLLTFNTKLKTSFYVKNIVADQHYMIDISVCVYCFVYSWTLI